MPSRYDDYPEEYSAFVRRREAGVSGDDLHILPHLLSLLGDITGQSILDAGCGEGYLVRVLAARGARVTGLDAAPRLIELARGRSPGAAIDYRVADLTVPHPEYDSSFDAVASYLVLNDVEDYRGFARSLARMLKPGGRMVHALNNPYGAVIRGHVADYFNSGAMSPYRGLWQAGIKTYHYHRTLQQYLDSFLEEGLELIRLIDVEGILSTHENTPVLPEGYAFPRFMLLAFRRPG